MEKELFDSIAEELRGEGVMKPKKQGVEIKLRPTEQECKDLLMQALQYVVGEKAQWLPEYDNIAKWMNDNRERGLLCYGNCGRGKTTICADIMPVLFKQRYNKIVHVFKSQEMNTRIDEILNYHLLMLDDVGIEQESVVFGNRRMAFPEIVDDAESKGKLLLITTNLTLDELESKYGQRTIDRLRAIVSTVRFTGGSKRG